MPDKPAQHSSESKVTVVDPPHAFYLIPNDTVIRADPKPFQAVDEPTILTSDNFFHVTFACQQASTAIEAIIPNNAVKKALGYKEISNKVIKKLQLDPKLTNKLLTIPVEQRRGYFLKTAAKQQLFVLSPKQLIILNGVEQSVFLITNFSQRIENDPNTKIFPALIGSAGEVGAQYVTWCAISKTVSVVIMVGSAALQIPVPPAYATIAGEIVAKITTECLWDPLKDRVFRVEPVSLATQKELIAAFGKDNAGKFRSYLELYLKSNAIDPSLRAAAKNAVALGNNKLMQLITRPSQKLVRHTPKLATHSQITSHDPVKVSKSDTQQPLAGTAKTTVKLKSSKDNLQPQIPATPVPMRSPSESPQNYRIDTGTMFMPMPEEFSTPRTSGRISINNDRGPMVASGKITIQDPRLAIAALGLYYGSKMVTRALTSPRELALLDLPNNLQKMDDGHNCKEKVIANLSTILQQSPDHDLVKSLPLRLLHFQLMQNKYDSNKPIPEDGNLLALIDDYYNHEENAKFFFWCDLRTNNVKGAENRLQKLQTGFAGTISEHLCTIHYYNAKGDIPRARAASEKFAQFIEKNGWHADKLHDHRWQKIKENLEKGYTPQAIACAFIQEDREIYSIPPPVIIRRTNNNSSSSQQSPAETSLPASLPVSVTSPEKTALQAVAISAEMKQIYFNNFKKLLAQKTVINCWLNEQQKDFLKAIDTVLNKLIIPLFPADLLAPKTQQYLKAGVLVFNTSSALAVNFLKNPDDSYDFQNKSTLEQDDFIFGMLTTFMQICHNNLWQDEEKKLEHPQLFAFTEKLTTDTKLAATAIHGKALTVQLMEACQLKNISSLAKAGHIFANTANLVFFVGSHIFDVYEKLMVSIDPAWKPPESELYQDAKFHIQDVSQRGSTSCLVGSGVAYLTTGPFGIAVGTLHFIGMCAEHGKESDLRKYFQQAEKFYKDKKWLEAISCLEKALEREQTGFSMSDTLIKIPKAFVAPHIMTFNLLSFGVGVFSSPRNIYFEVAKLKNESQKLEKFLDRSESELEKKIKNDIAQLKFQAELDRCNQLLFKKLYQEAAEVLSALAQNQQGDAKTKFLLEAARLTCLAQGQKQQHTEAIKSATKVLARLSDDTLMLFERARNYFNLKLFNDAKADLVKLLTIDANDFKANYLLGLTLKEMALFAFTQNKYNWAFQCYEEASVLFYKIILRHENSKEEKRSDNKRSPDELNTLENLYYESKVVRLLHEKNHGQLLKLCNWLLERQPLNYRALRLRAEGYVQLGQLQQARIDFTSALTVQEALDVRSNLAIICEQLGYFAEAANHLGVVINTVAREEKPTEPAVAQSTLQELYNELKRELPQLQKQYHILQAKGRFSAVIQDQQERSITAAALPHIERPHPADEKTHGQHRRAGVSYSDRHLFLSATALENRLSAKTMLKPSENPYAPGLGL